MAKKKPAAKPTRAGRAIVTNPAVWSTPSPTSAPRSTASQRKRHSGQKKKSMATKTVVHPGRCIKCQSTKHTGYRSIRTMQHLGSINGQPYTQIRWKRTNCADCGQARVDIFHEYRPREK